MEPSLNLPWISHSCAILKNSSMVSVRGSVLSDIWLRLHHRGPAQKSLLSHSPRRPSCPQLPSPVTGLGKGTENRETAMAFGLYSGVQTEPPPPIPPF